jgi:thiosulfate dehydrogenase (quinone) large subunit
LRNRDPDGGERHTAARCEGEELEQQMASDAAGRSSSAPVYIEEPAFSKWLFASSKAAWIWLVVRLWLGYEWLHAGWEKVRSPAWMAKLISVGEVIIGIALILGLFTGIFAFLGVVLNFSFVFSGSAGVNPLFIILGLLLVLAWRNAGWFGLDRFVLPRLGTPWHRGELFGRAPTGREPSTT